MTGHLFPISLCPRRHTRLTRKIIRDKMSPQKDSQWQKKFLKTGDNLEGEWKLDVHRRGRKYGKAS